MTVTTTIIALGHKGEGIAEVDGKRVFVPFALAGERVEIAIDGDRGMLVSVLEASTERAASACAHFGRCGGCQLQHLERGAYEAFKSGLVETALRHQGIEARVERLIDAAGTGRRRATLHVRDGQAGYMRQRSHALEDIEACPILVPQLARAPEIARAVGAAVGEADVAFSATLCGIDLAVLTKSKRAEASRLAPLMARYGLARLALNGELLLQAQVPLVAMGRAQVELPIGSFLQATQEAEEALADYVLAGIGKAKSVADLFCGVGPFALRVAERVTVTAFDSDRPAVAALEKAARHTKGLKQITARARDLFRDPLTRFELDGFDCVVLDPPRAGAQVQIEEIAVSKVKRVVMVACDPRSFARDAARLLAAGFAMRDLTALDQFAWSNHIEIAALFHR